MMSLWDALRMNMMISYQELVRTFLKHAGEYVYQSLIKNSLGREIIATLEAVNSEPVVIACTPVGAYVKS
ncbi:Uncharacterised protein [Kluyvera cryocrescens]|uniref:Uncharacterized protein n=1 Tax=Kluyvera cryocrescens TaxID=580 RepID=A0A485AX03_KLUCR|nr:Uncharacterised protein [Kluyvera cryocrescens]